MAEYIVAQRVPHDAPVQPSGQSSASQDVNHTVPAQPSRFPIITSLLRDFAHMSERSGASGKGSGRRGRRAQAQVPCSDCIQRASEKSGGSAALELCADCMKALHRPRARKQQEQPNTRKVRKQSHTVIDTALGIRTEPIAMPCELPVHHRDGVLLQY